MDLASLFEIEVGSLERLNFTADSAQTARIVILGLCAGLFLASLYSLYLRTVPGGLVRALLANGADSPANACTLDSLPLRCRGLTLAALAHNIALRRLIKVAPAPEGEGQEEGHRARYYLPEENTFRAERLFGKQGNPVLQLLLTLVGCLLLAVLLCKLLPVALSMIDAIL